MIYDLQRASMWKRISAWLLDAILLCIVATFMFFLLSAVLNYDSFSEKLDARYTEIGKQYGVSRDLTQAQVDAMTQEERSILDAASKAISEDEEALYAYNMMLHLIILITSLGILMACIILEFTIPMVLGNGQTIGKKIFGLGVMQQSGIRVNGINMFIRTVLGKYAIETMIPVMMVLMLFFGSVGEVGWLVAGGILLAEIILLCTTKERCMIHDKLANTVAIDFASQMIFKTQEDMIAYKQKAAAEKAANHLY